MRIFALTFFQLALLAALVGCGTTPPSQYFLLSEEARGMPGTSGPSIGVGPVDIPEYLKRPVMVLSEDRNKLELESTSRWAEPLDAGITRVTSLNLAVLLDTQKIQRYPWRRETPPEYGISINVVNLTMRESQARLAVDWTLRDVPNNEFITQRVSQFRIDDARPDPVGTAVAYSQLLLQLSEEIAAEITAHREAARQAGSD